MDEIRKKAYENKLARARMHKAKLWKEEHIVQNNDDVVNDGDDAKSNTIDNDNNDIENDTDNENMKNNCLDSNYNFDDNHDIESEDCLPEQCDDMCDNDITNITNITDITYKKKLKKIIKFKLVWKRSVIK